MSVKETILDTVELLGVNRLARDWTRRKLLGLCYHSIVSSDGLPGPEDDRTRIAVTAEQFEEQLEEIARHWNPVSLSELRRIVQGESKLPDRAVCITFDDGFRNNATVALPLLQKFNMPASIFLTTDYIGTTGMIWPQEAVERLVAWPRGYTDAPEPLLPPLPDGRRIALPDELFPKTRAAIELVAEIKRFPIHEREAFLETLRAHTTLPEWAPWQRELYEFLNWEEVRALFHAGIEIGAHTASHRNLVSLSPGELRTELAAPKERIERELGITCDAIAYPFGGILDISAFVVDTAQDAGYRIGFALRHTRNPEHFDPMRIDRLCIQRELSLASFRSLIAGWRN